jgi:hypothetical protein
MGTHRALLLLGLLGALCLLLAAASAIAEEFNEVHNLDNVMTEEGTTTQREIFLLGDEVVDAWFNFTVFDGQLNTAADSFVFTVRNLDDASVTQSLPGTTDSEGRLLVNLHFTRATTPNWRVLVSCTDAGDLSIGPRVIEEDVGNEWSLQVDYVYTLEANGGNGGNGNGGGGGGDDDGRPALVTAFEIDLLLVALLSLMVAFLAFLRFRGAGHLKAPYALGLVIMVDAFFALPIALLINQQENGVVLSGGPLGPDWLGNLALILLVLWVIPLLVAKRRLLTAPATHSIVSRVIGERVANSLRSRGEGMSPDPLPGHLLSVLVMLVGIASVSVVALMLML